MNFLKEYYPTDRENKLKNVGEVELARKAYIENSPKNLEYLLYKRYNWMNNYIDKNKYTIELGAGAGLSKFFIKEKIILTDIVKRNYIDKKIDALNIDVPDNSVDIFICTHMIHHLAKPILFLKNVEKKLVPGGLLLIHDTNTSIIMRLIMIYLQHEGFSYNIDVFDENTICNEPTDPWSANCAIPDMLFSDKSRFEKHVPLKIILNELNEFLILPLSGGVISKSNTINLPYWILRIVDLFDKLMIKLLQSVFAFGRSVVLQKQVK